MRSSASVVFAGPASPGLTLSPLRRGRGDPCYHVGADAHRAWHRLVATYGAPAPGPAPAHMRVPPSADAWRRLPSWEVQRANVDPGRARAIVGCAQRVGSLDTLINRSPEAARAALMSLPGVGDWTAGETVQQAFGDADAPAPSSGGSAGRGQRSRGQSAVWTARADTKSGRYVMRPCEDDRGAGGWLRPRGMIGARAARP